MTLRGARAAIVAGTVVVLSVVGTAMAWARAGDLDPTFARGGVAKTQVGPFDDYAYAVALQPDGRIVVAGSSKTASSKVDFAVARYTPRGALDRTFGGQGFVTTAIGATTDQALALGVQADGKIVLAGVRFKGLQTAMAVVRYTATGSLDPGFGTGGIVITQVGALARDTARAVAIQSDGGIVVAGDTWNGTDRDVAVVRYTSAGALDPTFDGDGIVTTPIGPGDDGANAVAVQSDGRIVVAGSSEDGAGLDAAVLRYTASGALDPTFGDDGVITTDMGGGDDDASAVALQSDGRIVVAGGADGGFALARYTASGALDPAFGTGGVTITTIGDGATARAVAIQTDGRVVAGGGTFTAANTDVALARYTRAGALDPSFGVGGTVTTAIGPGYDEAFGVAIQPDGRIVAVGSTTNRGGVDLDFTVVRYLAGRS